MKVEVRYYTKSGNTQKIANAIAQVADVVPQTTDVPIDSETDILFLGSSVYAAGVDEEVKKFIKGLTPDKVKLVVNFSTAALLPSTYKQVKALVEKQGIKMATEEFHCRGSFNMLHKDRPNIEDIKEAQAFAKSVLQS